MNWRGELKLALKLFFLLALVSCGSRFGKDRHSLVAVDLIQSKLKSNARCQIIDLRKEDEFDAGHIPTARRLWRTDIEDRQSQLSGMRISKKELENVLGNIGIHAYDSIFIYDAKGNVDAARLWWLLNYYGFEKVALIDGGYIQWRMKSYTVEEGLFRHPPTNFTFPETEQPTLLAEKEDVRNGHYEQLIDARSHEEYTGELLKNGALRGGHIPDAVAFDYMEMMDGGAFTLKSKESLLQLMKEKGLDPDKKTIAYCHSGVRSAFTIFVLREILQMEDASNYDGSWIEWSSDESCPIETANPEL